MSKFTKTDTHLMSWSEFDDYSKVLILKIVDYFNRHNEKINVITPILRSGGIIGSIIAVRMRIPTMLPVQFKYSYEPAVIHQIISVPDLMVPVPEDMNILLCDGNTNSGSEAIKATIAIKAKYPKANIYLATLAKVYGGPETLEGIKNIFYGTMTDENFKASEAQQKEFNLRKGITIFPWENIDDELADVNLLR